VGEEDSVGFGVFPILGLGVGVGVDVFSGPTANGEPLRQTRGRDAMTLEGELNSVDKGTQTKELLFQ